MNNGITNLNHAKIQNDGDPIALDDFAATSEAARVTCHFRNVRDALVGYINRYDYMVGCVAWLTDPVILRALATRCGVSIIVQKEDFLRPDCDERLDIRDLYGSIRSSFNRSQIKGILNSMSFVSYQELDAIRCVGNHNSNKSPAHRGLIISFLCLAVCLLQMRMAALNRQQNTTVKLTTITVLCLSPRQYGQGRSTSL